MIFLIIDTIEWRKFLINKNEKKYYIISTILIIMFLFSSRFLNSQNVDNTYRSLRKLARLNYEYEPSLFASYENDQIGNSQNLSFRVLADYIFGANDNDEKIAMTSPVVIKLHNNREMLFLECLKNIIRKPAST